MRRQSTEREFQVNLVLVHKMIQHLRDLPKANTKVVNIAKKTFKWKVETRGLKIGDSPPHIKITTPSAMEQI